MRQAWNYSHYFIAIDILNYCKQQERDTQRQYREAKEAYAKCASVLEMIARTLPTTSSAKSHKEARVARRVCSQDVFVNTRTKTEAQQVTDIMHKRHVIKKAVEKKNQKHTPKHAVRSLEEEMRLAKEAAQRLHERAYQEQEERIVHKKDNARKV